MADNETTLNTDIVINTDFKKAKKDINDLKTSFGKLSTEMENVLKKADKLSKKMPAATSTIRMTKNGNASYTGNPNNGGDARRLNKITESIIEKDKQIAALKAEQVEYLKKQNENYKQLLTNSTNKSTATLLRAESAQKETDKKIDSGYWDEKAKWMRYRNMHADMFTPIGRQKKYIIGRGISSFGQSLKGSGAVSRIISDLTTTVGKAIISPVAGAVTGFAQLAKAIIDVGKSSIEAAAQIEALKTNLSVVYGSETASNAAFREISQYAIKSPFGVEQTTEMAILLKQSGVYASDLMSTLRMIGDTAGGDAEKMKRIANNYAQIVSIGKASMLDMRQFAYAGIPIFEAVSKELGVSQAHLRKLISDGKVTSDIIEKVFKDLTGVNGIFENATAKGAQTLKARLQNLKDAKQLALAALGENLLNIGEKPGNKSIAMSFLGAGENFYSWLENWATIQNIEHDVHILATNRGSYENLMEQAEYFRNHGNDEIADELEAAAKEAKNIISIDKERAALSQLFLTKTADFFSMPSGTYDFSELAKGSATYPVAKETFYKINSLVGTPINEEQYREALKGVFSEDYINKQIEMYDKAGWGGKYQITSDEIAKFDANIKALNDAVAVEGKKNKEALDAFNKALTASVDELNAYREVLAMQTQQTASDSFGRNLTRSDSVFNVISEIREEYSQTEEGKAKAEKEKQKRWKEAIKILEDVKKHSDSSGNLQFSGLTVTEFADYLAAGVLSAERKLQLHDTDRAKASDEDIALARLQFQSFQQELIEMVYSKSHLGNKEAFDNLVRQLKIPAKEGKEFVKQLDTISQYMELFVKDMPEDIADSLRSALGATQLEIRVDNEDVILPKYGGGDNFIALYKRILGNAFGIDPKTITGTASAFDTYTKDLALRNRIGSVYYAGLKSGELSYDDIQRMNVMRAASTTLPDGGLTYQTNIQATAANAGKWGGKAWRSTEVFDANMSSVKESIDVLDKLMSSGILTPESQGVTSSKVITAEDLLKDTDLTGEMLVTAFGEKLVHAKTGEQLSVKDGKFYDSEGKEVAASDAIIQGNIYDKAKESREIFQEEWEKLKLTKPFNTLLDSLKNIGKDLAEDVFSAPLELVGKNLGHILAGYETWDSYSKDLVGDLRQIVAASLQQIGPAMTTAGFNIAGEAALQKNWGMVAAGLALAGAGGIVSGIGAGMLEDPKDETDKADREYEKAQDLKDQLADLLAQARSDALYYEKNLRHKTALGINKEFSYKSVNDAIISPSGDVITTHPDDYLIATKTPQAIGGTTVVEPQINFTVQNNVGSNINVRQEEKRNNDGSIQVTAIIEQVVGDYIASSRSDDAFMSREARAYGNRSIM